MLAVQHCVSHSPIAVYVINQP